MAKRPRTPRPVPPRRKDERRYNSEMRKAYLIPFFDSVTQRLAFAAALSEAYYQLDAAVDSWQSLPRQGIPEEAIAGYFAQVNTWHRERLIQTFRSALGVNIKPLLAEPPVAAFMTQKISENVDLIKTIVPEFHDSLKGKMGKLFVERPFDKAALETVLRDEFKSSGYNLRRLTRDQTNKTIGNLTEIRHRQAGIQRYIWQTSNDDRVRPTHAANDGKVFSWNEPPPTGHPGFGIQCRCAAIADTTSFVNPAEISA